MKVYLYLKQDSDIQIWSSYEEDINFWYVYRHPNRKERDSDVKLIELSVFEAKQIQKKHKKENTITPSKYWIEPAN